MVAGSLGSEAEHQTKVRLQSFTAEEKVSSVSALRQVGGQAERRDISEHTGVWRNTREGKRPRLMKEGQC